MKNSNPKPGTTRVEIESRLLTVDDVAELLQISVRGVWRQVSIGQIPKPTYIGRLARWRTSAISEWLEQVGQ